MSFGRITRPSYSTSSPTPLDCLPFTSNSGSSSTPYHSLSYSHQSYYEVSSSFRQPPQQVSFRPSLQKSSESRYDYEQFAVKPTSANPQDRSRRDTYDKYLDRDGRRAPQYGGELRKSNDAIFISDRDSIQSTEFRKFNEYQTIDRFSISAEIDLKKPISYLPRAGEFGRKEHFNQKPVRSRYQEVDREDDPIIIFTTDFNKNYRDEVGRTNYVNGDFRKSTKRLEGPTYQELKRRLNSDN